MSHARIILIVFQLIASGIFIYQSKIHVINSEAIQWQEIPAAAAALEISQQKLSYKETGVRMEIVVGLLDILIKKNKNELGRWFLAIQ